MVVAALVIRREGDGAFHLRGAFDPTSERTFLQALSEFDRDDRLILDLSELRSIDPDAIGAVVVLGYRVGALVLRAPPPPVAQTLGPIVALHERIEVERDGATDGPGAWSRWAACRARFRAASSCARTVVEEAGRLVADTRALRRASMRARRCRRDERERRVTQAA